MQSNMDKNSTATLATSPWLRKLHTSSGAHQSHLKLGITSDSHGSHANVKINKCDVLIHCGDCTSDIGQASLRDFLGWFEEQDAEIKILIAGNHDGAFEKWPEQAQQMVKNVAPSVLYLQDSGVEIDGIKFWGSPVTPRFFDWFFNRDRGEDIKRHWDLIPRDTDVLITHGPPKGHLDKVIRFNRLRRNLVECVEHTGCKDLYEAVLEIQPMLHCFGHIHVGYGSDYLVHDNGLKTTFINASACDENYIAKNAVFYYDIATKKISKDD